MTQTKPALSLPGTVTMTTVAPHPPGGALCDPPQALPSLPCSSIQQLLFSAALSPVPRSLARTHLPPHLPLTASEFRLVDTCATTSENRPSCCTELLRTAPPAGQPAVTQLSLYEGEVTSRALEVAQDMFTQ